MADFVRKKRNIKYNDLDCKRYLRKDFDKKCAYCGIREGDLSGAESFQIDHFKPQVCNGTNDYDNLFYCCSTCNGKSGKSDYYSSTLLNPCIDDIYSNKRVYLDKNYYLTSTDSQGLEYISALKLNRKSYIKRRKCINKAYNDAKKICDDIKQLLKQCNCSNEIYDAILEKNKKVMDLGSNYLYCTEDDEIEDMFERRISKFCEFEMINDDYNVDYRLKQDNLQLYVHLEITDLNFQDHKAYKFLSSFELAKWSRLALVIVYYDKCSKNYYYYSVKMSENDYKESNRIRICIDEKDIFDSNSFKKICMENMYLSVVE